MDNIDQKIQYRTTNISYKDHNNKDNHIENEPDRLLQSIKTYK